MATTAPNQTRPRRGTRTFSFRSDKTKASADSKLQETPLEKESHRLHSKADPTRAMQEAEPSAVQATEQTSLAPLRAIQHKDVFGNPIAEPDRSNPTRSRWERPLDTIRSFEAAIDGPYARRPNAPAESEADWHSKRGSYYNSRSYAPSRAQSIVSNPNGPRYPNDNYYGSRPTSHFEPRAPPSARDSYHESHHYGPHGYYAGGPGGHSPGNGAPYQGGGGYSGYATPNGMPYQNRQRPMRMQSESQFNYNRRDQNGVYPLQHRDRSYETVASAAGSGVSGDHGSYQTDPSSDNSSFDRVSPPKQSPPMNDYGLGFSQPSYQQPAFSVHPNGASPVVHKKPVPGTLASNLPPSVPRKDIPPPQSTLAPAKPVPEKRKSWLFRRFSRTS